MVNIRSQLLYLFIELDSEQLLPILFRHISRKRKDLEALLTPSERLSFNKYSDNQFKRLFRFAKEDIPRLLETLRIPAVVIAPNRSRPSGTEALCLALRRMIYPCR